MSLEKLVSRYIGSTEHVLENMETVDGSIDIDVKMISEALEWVKAYLKDAKYYRDRKRFGVSLASIAYCEGLLDALRMLGAVKFKWPTRKKKKPKK